MGHLDCGYAGANSDIIRLCADLDCGWRELGGKWGFDEQDFLPSEGDSKFRCRVRFIEKAPSNWESRRTFPERYLLNPITLGNNLVSLHGTKLEVDIPLTQDWVSTNDSNRRPSIYVMKEDVFEVETIDGVLNYRLQVWVVLHGQSRMFVKEERELGDGFAWVGGRPESNRRKF
jgi:hypothetical protein